MIADSHFRLGVVLASVTAAAMCCASWAAGATTCLTEFTSPEQLDLSGNFVYAIDVGGTVSSEISDLVFAAGDAPGSGIDGYTNTMSAVPLTETVIRPEFGSSEDAEALEDVLQTVRWDQADGAEVRLRVTRGKAYKLQLLFWMPRSPRFFDVNIEGKLVLDEFNPAWTYRDVAFLCAYEYVAGDNRLNIVFAPGGTKAETLCPILNALTLEEIRTTWIPGDADGDSVVDEIDAAILAAHWGQTVTGWDYGDFNGDCRVNAADAAILTANWGNRAGEESAALAVPEPLGIAVLLPLSLWAAMRRRA